MPDLSKFSVEQLREYICNKAEENWLTYLHELKKADIHKVVNQSYETAPKEITKNILRCSYLDVFGWDDLIALASVEDVLEAVYNSWSQDDLNISETVKDAIQSAIDYAKEKQE